MNKKHTLKHGNLVLKSSLWLVVAFSLLTSCSSMTKINQQASTIVLPSTLYQYQMIQSDNHKLVDIKELTNQLKNTQVIFFGELHSHQASHKFQLDLLQALYRQNPKLILSMEQFSRDAQGIVDGYLDNQFGEETLIEEGGAWPIYKGAYRPLVEFAREHHIPVIAANAPAMFVRCVGKNGFDILKKLSKDKKSWSAQALDFNNKKYRDKFMSFLKQSGSKHGQSTETMGKRMMKSYSAQLLRDTTMAESIANALKHYPDHQLLHLNGSFHSDGRLGTVAVLEKLKPELSIKVISPLMLDGNKIPELEKDDYQQGDFLYLVKALPERYLDKDKEDAAIYKLIKERMGKKCNLNQ